MIWIVLMKFSVNDMFFLLHNRKRNNWRKEGSILSCWPDDEKLGSGVYIIFVVGLVSKTTFYA